MKEEKKLIYNVYRENFNRGTIEIYNIFDHYNFYQSLVDCKKRFKNDFTQFADAVKQELMYYFWSKSEYEVIITSWPTYVDSEEIDNLIKEREEHLKKYGTFYRECVNLTVGEKIDIYNQVLLNWDIFIKYLWENKGLLKKKKV